MPAAELRKLVGDDVSDSALFKEAITHRSAGGINNERLEYLGDAVLDLIVAEILYRRFAEAREGDLSRLRSHLVRKETLAAIAKEIGLGGQIILGPGELKSGGFQRDTILSDALEAVIGAVYVLKGLDQAKELVVRLFADRLKQLPPFHALKDPKSRLQEILQARNLELPTYSLVKVQGASHAQEFAVRCSIPPLHIEVTAWGTSKRKAEQACAEQALTLIEREHLLR